MPTPVVTRYAAVSEMDGAPLVNPGAYPTRESAEAFIRSVQAEMKANYGERAIEWPCYVIEVTYADVPEPPDVVFGDVWEVQW